MKKNLFHALVKLLLIGLITACSSNSNKSIDEFYGEKGPRMKLLFDKDWNFHRGDLKGAEAPSYNDDSWRELDLPHDWSIEDIPGTDSPLDSSAIGGINTGYYTGGTGWYRKDFNVPAQLSGKRLFLLFEGVYMDSDVWINGIHMGNHPYGYTSFWYDVTDAISFGDINKVAVRVRNEGKNSRWYSGSGIYRHVWLMVTEQVHVPIWGTGVTTPSVSAEKAVVEISNKIVNNDEQPATVDVNIRILNMSGEIVASQSEKLEVGMESEVELTQELEILSPQLWSTESPELYKVMVEIEGDGSEMLDRVEETFGIRSIEFSTEGFFLNGDNVLLKGGCMHHDNGPLGAAAYDRAEERRVELMKESGFNSIRCAHNPPSPAFLRACDRLGILVIDEAFDQWRKAKNPQDYHRFFDSHWKKDIESMVLRDRNHPSIIMWSTGNEIVEQGTPEGTETSRMLAEYVRELDPTRPVTSAVNRLSPDKQPYFNTLDVAGYNYSFAGDHGVESIFRVHHKEFPDRIMYCSESYPLTAFGAWMDVLDNPYVIGDYVWTGFDYLGESSIGWLGYLHDKSFYPWNHAYCGDIDICGIKRPQSYYRNVLWKTGKQLSVFVKPPVPSFEENPDRMDWSKWHWHDVVDRWNWPGYEQKPLVVEVYCAHEEVELFLNDESLGRKKTNRGNEWIAHWEVPYQPGILKAVAYNKGEQVESDELRTASEVSQIHLSADRPEILANGRDLSYVMVELRDKEGHRNTLASDLVHFRIEGPGTIVAVGSSNPMSTESFQQSKRKAYQGRCMVIVKSENEKGEIKLMAESDGIDSGSIMIRAN